MKIFETTLILFKSSWDTVVLGHQWTCFNHVSPLLSPHPFNVGFSVHALFYTAKNNFLVLRNIFSKQENLDWENSKNFFLDKKFS